MSSYNFPDNKTIDVVGLGNALMDFLIEVDETMLATTGLGKGGMHLVEEEQAKQLLDGLAEIEHRTVPGGAAANTIKTVAALGGQAVLFANVGADSHGESYIEAIELHGVTSRIRTQPLVTGHALTFITPDAERTFSVHLGAALSLGKDDLEEADIAASKVLYLEAFQLEGPTKETVLHAILLAKKHATKVALDLNDAALIERNFDFFHQIVADHVDIVFANELEAKAFTGKEEDRALAELAKDTEIAILKLGEQGSRIACQGEILSIPAESAEVIDTTGAGDTYAAGFLYGLTHGLSVAEAGKLGSQLAARVIEVVGVEVREIVSSLDQATDR